MILLSNIVCYKLNRPSRQAFRLNFNNERYKHLFHRISERSRHILKSIETEINIFSGKIYFFNKITNHANLYIELVRHCSKTKSSTANSFQHISLHICFTSHTISIHAHNTKQIDWKIYFEQNLLVLVIWSMLCFKNRSCSNYVPILFFFSKNESTPKWKTKLNIDVDQ